MATLTNAQKSSLYSLYAGGQYKHSSIPVAEARAVLGVPHAIETDDIETDDIPEGILPSDCRRVYY
jgi:hypothetical protein